MNRESKEREEEELHFDFDAVFVPLHVPSRPRIEYVRKSLSSLKSTRTLADVWQRRSVGPFG